MTQKLKASEIRAYRQQAVQDQGYKCPLCEQPLTQQDAVLDHRHSDGLIRQAIHRFCNTFLGKIENNVIRNRITPEQLEAILRNYERYVQHTQVLLHPTHRTAEERLLRNKQRAKRRRLLAKSAKSTKKVL
jgi:hypothetical protein